MSFGKNYDNPVSTGIFAPHFVNFTYTESERERLSLAVCEWTENAYQYWIINLKKRLTQGFPRGKIDWQK